MCLAPATLTVSFSALLHTPAPLTLLSFPSSLLSPFPARVSLSYRHSLDEHTDTSRTEESPGNNVQHMVIKDQ